MPKAKVTHLFRRCLTRSPTAEETTLLTAFYRKQKDRLAKNELNATALASPGSGDVQERAAWTIVARALLNLDETIAKD